MDEHGVMGTVNMSTGTPGSSTCCERKSYGKLCAGAGVHVPAWSKESLLFPMWSPSQIPVLLHLPIYCRGKGGILATVGGWRPKDSSQESVLFFHYPRLRDQTQVGRDGSEDLLNNLASLILVRIDSRARAPWE